MGGADDMNRVNETKSILKVRSVERGLLLFLLLGIELSGSASPCLPLKAGRQTGDAIVPGAINGIIYRRTDRGSLEMDAYRQPGAARRPAVIVIHGGGWRSGSRVSFVGQYLELLSRAGYHWFSIDYRMGGESGIDVAVSDLQTAVEFIRCHARELKVDPERILLLGEDTGATMAAMVARDPSARISGQILIGGRYQLLQKPGNKDVSKSPVRTLLVHGTGDSEVAPEEAARYCSGLRAAEQICDFLPVDGGSHRAENWWPSQWGYKARLIEWLDEQTEVARGSFQVTQLRKDIVYDQERGLKLDALIPRGKGPFPAVILVHGGGWEAGDKVTYVTPVMRPLASAGFAWFSIDYRLTPGVKHPEQLDDLRSAIRFVHRHAERYNIDRRRIAILGESASGQMVAQIATEGLPEVAAVVSFYGVYDFLQMASRLGPRSIPSRLFGIRELGEVESEILVRYSPLKQAHGKMPPLLLLCGTADGLYRQQQSMVARLSEVGARFEAIELLNAPHGMENWEGHPEWDFYKGRLTAWLKRWLAR